MVTRRVHKRQLLLLGDPMVDRGVKYTLAYCLQKYDIKLHALITEGNHIHQVDTDDHANLPDFFRDFHSFIARQLNIHYREHDAFWARSQTNVVANETANDVIERIKYAMGNPVADGSERYGDNHNGIRMRWPAPPETIERPPFFWVPKEHGGKAPATLDLVFTRPPGFDGLSDDELDRIIEQRVLDYEQQMRDKRDAQGKPFLCDSPERKRNPRDVPTSTPTLFRLAPLIGARLRKVRLAAIARLQTFRIDHDNAMAQFRAGNRDVVFPHGTYGAARRWNVNVAPAPS